MGKQSPPPLLLLLLLLILSFVISLGLFRGHCALAAGTDDGSEQWGYVEVRPKAHLFWWLYRSPYRVEDPSNPWPTILWLQGGPGTSGAGLGNFLEIGPVDVKYHPRNSTWLKKADLLFVDNPVGAGFSYVEDKSLLVKTDEDAAADLTTLLKELFNSNKTLQKSPLYIIAESYGGKFAVTLGLSAIKAIEAGKLNLQLGGIALGNSWISPEDFVASWGPLLKDLSRMDENGLEILKRLVLKIHTQLAQGAFTNATSTWGESESVVLKHSNDVDFYNFLLDSQDDPIDYDAGAITKLMNGLVRKKLKIIPQNVTWKSSSSDVFEAMAGDFMKPRIREVDELLAKGVNVTIYNGQIDLICSTKGVESWINKLQWDGLKKFQSLDRIPLYCGQNDTSTKAFSRSYKNFSFYWILGAGHYVPVDQPCTSLQMVGTITRSPN
ncbi:hypothetical protein SLE2022_112740 [Rubroshorea leprosula]